MSLDDLVAFNEWSSAAEFPFPGTTIKIPPGATAAAATEGTADEAEDPAATETAEDEGPADTIPEAGDNCEAGSYTITADDTTRIGVAEKFDVTAVEVSGEERARLYDQQAEQLPVFKGYAEKAAGIRAIPVFRLVKK